MLVVGGGIIGLEMATVYDALGVKVSVVELTKTLIPGCDRDLVKPLEKRIAARYEAIMLGTRVHEDGSRRRRASPCTSKASRRRSQPQTYGLVLVAVGRSANGRKIAADKAGVEVNERGLIEVDKQQRTNVRHIFAIGDIVGQPMLAHKASHEGKVAAEVAAGEKSFFDARVVPSRGVHGSRGRVGRAHGGRSEGARRRLREGHVSVGRERALADARSRRRSHEAVVRRRHQALARRRHRRQ